MLSEIELSAFYTPLLLFSRSISPTLCDPMDCSPPDSSVHGISQARNLEWVAISSFKGSSQPRDRICISCISCIGRQSLPLSHPLLLPDVTIIQNFCFSFSCFLKNTYICLPKHILLSLAGFLTSSYINHVIYTYASVICISYSKLSSWDWTMLADHGVHSFSLMWISSLFYSWILGMFSVIFYCTQAVVNILGHDSWNVQARVFLMYTPRSERASL